MKTRLIALSLGLALLSSVVLPSSTMKVSAASAVQSAQVQTGQVQSHPAAFDKTKFLLHLGFAYFAFHHFVWKPYRAGKLSRHHLITVALAGVALIFAYHEVKKAYNIAKTSNSRTLQALFKPMNALASSFSAIGTKLKHGQVNNSDVSGLNTKATAFQMLSRGAGYSIADKATSVR